MTHVLGKAAILSAHQEEGVDRVKTTWPRTLECQGKIFPGFIATGPASDTTLKVHHLKPNTQPEDANFY